MPQNNTAIVYVHGHMGTSRQFDFFSSLLSNQPCDEYRVVLPGHESSLQAFAQSDRHEWQECVDEFLSELRTRYDHLILLGHSMGGLLLILSAIHDPDSIDAILCLALPLSLRLTFRALNIRLRSIQKPRAHESHFVSAAREFCGVADISVRNAWRLLPNTIGLLRIIRDTRRKLPRLSVPLTIFNSRNDEIVSIHSLRIAKRKYKSTRSVTLENASHFWYPEDEMKQIARYIVEASPGCEHCAPEARNADASLSKRTTP